MNPSNNNISGPQGPNIKALTPQQTTSWPIEMRPYTITGEKLHVSAGSDTAKERFMFQALERFEIARNYENNRRLEMEQDLRFAAGEQWDQEIINQRRAQGRPCLVINRVDGFLAHAVNNMRQSRPAIKIDPVGEGADEQDALIRQGLIRHIETNSRADRAYDTGFEAMCRMGLGWIRIVDDWAGPQSFDKELYIRWVPDPFLIYSDPYVSQPDWSDMKWCFVIEDLTRGEFKARFGERKDAVSINNFDQVGSNYTGNWFPGGRIRIAEYFHIEQEEDLIYEMDAQPGKIYRESEAPLNEQFHIVEGDEIYDTEGRHIGRLRSTTVPVVHWDLISGDDILERRIWKGKYIPLIPVIGNQTILDGEKLLVGMVRYAREPQRMYNYMYTGFIETVALAPKAPFVAEIDQIPDGLIEEWQKANTDPTAVLRYKARLVEGTNQLAPPPMRQQAEPPIAAYVEGLQMCDQNLKSIFRIYDASLGQRGPQESGLAINARKVESDTGIYNWGDNFVRSLEIIGTILNDLLPYYYNTPGKVIRVLQDDLTTRTVTIGKEFSWQGVQRFFDLSLGEFAVVVSTGPTAQTKRQEASMAMTELVKVYPQMMQIAGDLVVGEMDFVGKDAIAARLRMALPPGLQPPSDQDAMPPAAQMQLQQAGTMINQLHDALKQALDKKDLQLMKEEWETMRTQMVQETQLAAAALKAKSDQAQFLSEKIFDELNNMRAMFLPIAQHMMATQLGLGGAQPTPGDGSAPPPPPQVNAPPSAPLAPQSQAIPPSIQS